MTGSRRVLILDDELDYVDVLSMNFKSRGWEVVAANNLAGILERISNPDFDLVLTDIRMPGISGLKVIEQLKHRDFTQPVIIAMSGFLGVNREDIYHCGAEGLISKPFVIKSLFEEVERLISPLEVRVKSEKPITKPQIEIKVGTVRSELAHTSPIEMGRGGFFIYCDKSSPFLGQRITFKISFETGELHFISGTGAVRWARPKGELEQRPGFGLEFLSLTEDCRSDVLAWMSKHLTAPYIPRN